MRHVLTQLPQLAIPSQVMRHPAGIGPHRLQQKGVDLCTHVRSWLDVPAQRQQEHPLQLAAKAQHGRVPLALVVDVLEAPVVQLVATMQRELQVIPVRIGSITVYSAGDSHILAAQQAQHGGRQWSPGSGSTATSTGRTTALDTVLLPCRTPPCTGEQVSAAAPPHHHARMVPSGTSAPSTARSHCSEPGPTSRFTWREPGTGRA